MGNNVAEFRVATLKLLNVVGPRVWIGTHYELAAATATDLFTCDRALLFLRDNRAVRLNHSNAYRFELGSNKSPVTVPGKIARDATALVAFLAEHGSFTGTQTAFELATPLKASAFREALEFGRRQRILTRVFAGTLELRAGTEQATARARVILGHTPQLAPSPP